MRKILVGLFLALAGGVAAFAALAGDTPAPKDARAWFVTLEDGATVTAPVTIVFGLKGMGVAPAGVEKAGTGHHHVLVDRPPFGEGPNDAGIMANGIPSDDHHVHFGGGQTQTTLGLSEGEHTLQLLLADAFHLPHDPPVTSEHITITVE